MLKYIEALKHGKHGWFGLSWRSFLFQTSGLLEVRFLVVRFQSFPGGSYPEKKWGNLELFPKVRTWGIRPYFDTILDAVPYVHMCFLILYVLHLFFFWMKIDDDMNNIGVCWQNIMMKPYKCLNLSHFLAKKTLYFESTTYCRWHQNTAHFEMKQPDKTQWHQLAANHWQLCLFCDFRDFKIQSKKKYIHIYYIVYTWQFFVTFLGWLSDPSKGCCGPPTGGSKGHIESPGIDLDHQ